MARNESKALGGYYKTPVEVIPAIAALCARGAGDHYSILDPCAADGEAATLFARAAFGDAMSRVNLYAIELEASRYRTLAARGAGDGADFVEHRLHALHGDAFAAEWSFTSPYRGDYQHRGASVAWSNYPYDDQRAMEERFLARFTPALQPSGVLVMLVPFYSLGRLAPTLAQHYRVTACFRFPEPLFSQDATRAFKQVCLFAVRRDSLLDPDAATAARLLGWSRDASTIPVLPEAGTAAPIVTIPGHPYHQSGYGVWRMRNVDNETLLTTFMPFHATNRNGSEKPVPGMVAPPAADLLCRRYPVAVPLRPAHIATAIAAGVFNGALVTPDDPEAGWPDLLVKGVFNREFTEVDEKVNKKGEKTASVKVQQPRLQVTVLDLRAGTYHTLVDSDSESDADTVAGITTADLLAIYGKSLMRVMLENCPVLHNPADAAGEIPIADVARPLYRAQHHAAQAIVKLLGGDKPVQISRRARFPRRRTVSASVMELAVRRHFAGKTAVLLGEAGSGKSSCALATAKTLALPVLQRGGAFRTLIFCPPHLLKSWRDQAAAVVPEARVVVLESVANVDALAADDRPGLVLAILSRETAKLGHAWEGIGRERVVAQMEQRDGCGFTPPQRVVGGRSMALTLHVGDIASGGEVWAGVETSVDGARWEAVATFAEMSANGTQTIGIRVPQDARYVRAAWSSAGPATFAVVEAAHDASTCPRCGTPTPKPAKVDADHRGELARVRLRCPRTARGPHSLLARAVRTAAETIYQAFPHAGPVRGAMTGVMERRLLDRAAERVPDMDALQETEARAVKPEEKAALAVAVAGQGMAWRIAQSSPRLRVALDMAVRVRCRSTFTYEVEPYIHDGIRGLAWAIGDDEVTARAAVRIYKAGVQPGKPKDDQHDGRSRRDLARDLLLMLPSGAVRDAAVAECLATGVDDRHYSYSFNSDPWRDWQKKADTTVPSCWHNAEWGRGNGQAAVFALGKLSSVAVWETSAACDEPLYQAVADPQRGGRRYALAKYIGRRHRRLFDFVVLDEAHEAASGESAQGRAAWRLAGLGAPVLAMTGTIMGGYAEALFNMSIALDPAFRDEFTRKARGEFVDRYGYVKVQERDVSKDTGNVVAYGSVSDRVERETRILGNAPGVLPLYLLRYLLRFAVVLHKVDLQLELPPCREISVMIEPTEEISRTYGWLLEKLKDQIKADRFDRERAGKLFGALAHFATDYPLLASADTGNAKGGNYEIRYPDNPQLGLAAGQVVVGAPGFPRDKILPIEQWTIDTVRAELAEGRRCMVLATSALLLPRLRRLLEKALGEPVVHLDAKKVDTGNREQWLLDNVVNPGVRVLVVNPVAIQTGLNPLVHFATELWLQNPSCQAINYRQAVARVDRIGQKSDETRIYFATYNLAPAHAAYALLMHKVAVSMATDGLDAGGALAAAGVGGSDRLDGFSVGKLIFDVMNGERSFKPRKHVAAGAAQRRAADGRPWLKVAHKGKAANDAAEENAA